MVVHLIQFLLEVTNISSPLLMISVENYGFNLSKRNLLCSFHYIQKFQGTCWSGKFTRKMESSNSLQLHTHHSKMALQRGKIGRSLIWQGPCLKKNVCQSIFGQKQWHVQPIYSIDALQKIWHHKRRGVDTNQVCHT